MVPDSDFQSKLEDIRDKQGPIGWTNSSGAIHMGGQVLNGAGESNVVAATTTSPSSYFNITFTIRLHKCNKLLASINHCCLVGNAPATEYRPPGFNTQCRYIHSNAGEHGSRPLHTVPIDF